MGLTPDQRAELKRIAEAATLPDVLPGHWGTAEGAEMAREYAGKARSYLAMSDVPDLALANAVFLADRYDLQLIHYQQAAKERIRWLSVQLALANARIEALEGERDAARADLERHRRPKCSCMEVYGENPNCIQHGHGTEWAKANPDICAWADERRDKDARIEALEAGLKNLNAAVDAYWNADPRNREPEIKALTAAQMASFPLLGDRHD